MNEFKISDYVIDIKVLHKNSEPLMFVINHINHYDISLELKRYKGEDSLTYIRKFNEVKKITKEANPEYFV